MSDIKIAIIILFLRETAKCVERKKKRSTKQYLSSGKKKKNFIKQKYFYEDCNLNVLTCHIISYIFLMRLSLDDTDYYCLFSFIRFLHTQ